MSHLGAVNEVDQLPVLTTAGGGYLGATTMGNIRNPLQASPLLPVVSLTVGGAGIVPRSGRAVAQFNF
jgi:hypothetical protein